MAGGTGANNATQARANLKVEVAGQHGLRTYRKGRDGTIDAPETDARALIREGLAVAAGVAGPTAHIRGGFVCEGCGRRNYFRRCGGCGQES